MAPIVAGSVRHRPRAGLLTLCGTTSAMVVPLALVGVGMTTLPATVSVWCGALRRWRRVPGHCGRGACWCRSPTKLLFFGAFFPQFIHRDAPALPQVVWLLVTFVVVAAALDCRWALLAARLRRLILARGRLLNRIGAACWSAPASGWRSRGRSSDGDVDATTKYWYLAERRPMMSKTTSFSLGEHFNGFVDTQLHQGRYRNASEVVRAGLRLLEGQELQLAASRAALIQGAQSGSSVPFDFEAFIAAKRVDSTPPV